MPKGKARDLCEPGSERREENINASTMATMDLQRLPVSQGMCERMCAKGKQGCNAQQGGES